MMIRLLYLCVLRLHPPYFRQRFAEEMLWIFDHAAGKAARFKLLADGVASLIRQWAVRSEFWEEPVAAGCAHAASHDAPVLFTFENSMPRRSSLIQGGILSVVVFNAISFAIHHGGGHTFPMPLAGSRDTGNPQTLAFSSWIASPIHRTAGRRFEEKPIALNPERRGLKKVWSELVLLVGRSIPRPRTEPAIPETARGRQPGVWLRAQARNGSWWRPTLGTGIRANIAQLRAVSPGNGPAVSRSAADEVVNTLMSQFDRSDVVALGEWHSTREDSELRIKLLHHPDFPKKVHYIVVECANSLYQDVLDRYIAGKNVGKQRLQKVWRNVTSPGGCDSPVYEQFLNEVRSLNRNLSGASKIRVLAGDPAIDWAKVKTFEDVAPIVARRDAFPAELIAREVLGKGRKALVIYGAGHLWRKTTGVVMPADSTLVALIEKKAPGRIYTVVRVAGVYPDSANLEHLIKGAELPVLLPLKGPAGDLAANVLIGRDLPIRLFPNGLGIREVADACVYSGRTRDTTVKPDPSIDADRGYAAEKNRRTRLRQHPSR